MKWETVKLESVAEVIAGQSPESQYYNQSGDGFPFFQGKADFGYETPTVRYWCTKPTKIAKENDILLSVRAPVGPTNICNLESCIGRGLAAIRVGQNLNHRFLYWWFKSYEHKLSLMGNGSTFSAITTKDVKGLTIPLPPLPIQQQIADTLDKADALRRKDQELLDKYDELAQAVFYEMFGDPVRNEKGWAKESLNNCVIGKYGIKAGPFGSSLKKEFYTTEGYKIYGQEQVILDDLDFGDYFISEEKYRELESCKVSAGDVLISMVGTYGKISVVPEQFTPGIINPRLVKLTLEKTKLEPLFFKYLFQLPETKIALSSVSRGGTMDILNAGILKEFKTILPPIKLQLTFLNILQKIQFGKQLLKDKISEKLFNCVMQTSFN